MSKYIKGQNRQQIYLFPVSQRFEFDGFYEAKLTITAYVDFYNNRRIHGGIEYLTPQQKWDDNFRKEINNFNTPVEAEAGNAGEQPARNKLANGNDTEGVKENAPSTSENESFLLQIPQKTQSENNEMNSNLLEKFVRFNGG